MQDCSSRARTLLSHKYSLEFKAYRAQLHKELEKHPHWEGTSYSTRDKSARARAKTALVKKYSIEFADLREQLVKEGYPRSRRRQIVK